jgi:predicted nucleotidyltransferase
MILQKLKKAEMIHPPRYLVDNTMYLCQMGSVAYGVSGESSDIDVYGYCVPPRDLVFPHLAGVIPGFGTQLQRFDVWQEHHVKAPDSDKEYDFSVYSIVKYFDLCMQNNPNMIDSLFVPRRCILHSTELHETVRDRRHMFLHRGAFHKFKGYAYSQMSKIRENARSSNPARAADIEKYGYSTKFAYHLVRLACEAEQILVECDLDLERNREQLKSIRRGEWKLEDVEKWFAEKERHLEGLYATSKLPERPDEEAIRQLLLDCLEHHYGSLSAVVARDRSVDALVRDLQAILERYSSPAIPDAPAAE